MPTEIAPSGVLDFLSGGGDMGARMRAFDWSSTPLGDAEAWPQSLKTAVNLILNSQHAMWIGWGPAMTCLYNDAYVHVLGTAKHEWALGRPASEVWAETWHIIGPLAEKVFREGAATYVDDMRLFMSRGDFLEETYYSYSYSPIRDESGQVGGLFCPSTDVTPKVVNARRLRTLSELAANALVEKTTSRACASAMATLAKNPDDIPFALLYLADAEGRQAELTHTASLPDAGPLLSPSAVALAGGIGGDVVWPIADVFRTAQPRTISVARYHSLPRGAAGQPVREAIVLPVASAIQERPVGVLIAGLNPTCRPDTEYRTFFELISGQIATAIQSARAEEDLRASEQRLAAELAATQRLQETSTQMIAEDKAELLYEHLLDAAVAIMGSDYASLQMLYPERGPNGELRLLAFRGFSPQAANFWQWVAFSSESTTCGVGFRTQQRVVVPDVDKCEFMAGTQDLAMFVQTGIRAMQSTPLLSRTGEPVGMISTHWNKPHEPSERDLRLFDILARQAADLIERRRAEEALRQNEAWLASQREALENALNGAPLEASLGVLVRAATAALGQGVRAAFYLSNLEGTELHHVAGMPADYAEAVNGFKIGPESLACGLAMHNGQPVLTTDVTNDPLWTPWAWLAAKFDYRGCWSFPIHTMTGTFVGTFAVYWREPREATLRDQKLAARVTQTAGLIISRHMDADVRRRAEERLATVVQHLPVGVGVIDPAGHVTMANAAWKKFLRGDLPSVDSVEAANWRATSPDGRELMCSEYPGQRALRGEEVLPGIDFLRKGEDGVERWTRVSAVPLRDPAGQVTGALAMLQDIDQERRAEAQRAELLAKERALEAEKALRETEAELARVVRALSIGELATSIAHEINQPLAGAVTNAQAGLRWLNSNPPNIPETKDSLALVVRDGMRASAIIKRIREFLGKGRIETASLNLNDIVQDTAALAQSELEKRQVSLRTELASGLPQLRGDRIQLQQVILNLIMNGAEAMDSIEGPKELVVRSCKAVNGGVAAAVQDFGGGINPRDLSRMFDPLFTTKPTGIGMGLSISRSIIEAHGGRIWAERNQSSGLTVRFELPADGGSAT